MKRITVLAVLVLSMAVLAACAPKPEEINAVVNDFFGQWKAGNTSKMTDLMTSEVYLGMFLVEMPSGASSVNTPDKRVPALTIAEFLITDLSLDPDSTLSITKTDVYDGYAFVESVFDLSPDDSPDVKIPFTFHLKETDDGWKIYLIYYSTEF